MSKQTSFFTSVGRLYPHVRPILPRLFMGLICALLASIVALTIPQVLRVLVNNSLQPGGSTDAVWIAAVVILALGIAEAGLVALRRQFVINPATTVETRMRVTLYGHLQELTVAFHDRWGSGQLLSRAMTDLSFLRRWMAFGAIMLVVTTLTVIIGVGVMFSMSWQLALIFLAAAVPIMINSFRFRRRFSLVARLSQDQAGDLATTVEESVHGIRVLKAFGRSREALENFNGQAEELRQTEIAKAKQQAGFTLVVTLLPELALGVGLVVGVMLAASGQLSIGALVAFFATAAVVATPVEFSGMLLAMALTAKTALDRHFEVMDTENTITSPETAVVPETVKGALRFDHAGFGFDDGGTLLHDITLDIRPGETMALVGITGSGKSALLQLVPRLYDVTAGAVTIDGVDVRDFDIDELRKVVAVAFEDTTLFSSSVRDNVLLGAPDPSDAALDEALDVAQAHFAYSLPDGVDTLIGEEGLSLSGGQRQRIALARAIAAKPKVLVLDDPLSALDVNTEERVEARLREVLRETTTLIVAHRPSTVALADRVALLENGTITAVGTHTELLAENDHYRYVIASLDAGPKDLDTELDELEEAEEARR
ncbi:MULTISPECIES: ABC transporter ATP-binding protein [Paenarthrobacter]|jgi:ATP-binding cassette subfamily B protein|uniref:ABC transporter ATP-binding protein n=1 Tax=Paenarthrobacter TaxID=1742992 RepID=UPI000D7BE9FC|nr:MULTISPECIES: ABC transporter ATP-binding protein [Paenarthrobacter]BCW41822.1 ABC transporter [Arthrobacter sp. StoSoilB3]MBP2395389.1 ATP-binding cassette subfamily B protein [Paenarthrobacter nicotinovorans]UKE98477.1 ABC transporter ATP-binding protein/permease [Paenarthrobacter nicotinovorans]UKF03265.1 ABC transporter ATP-binding protein/permease [Paenarthrobacter nicotinovorans]GGV24455.1 ABC transporter [Paenarthrobacter nicotinovorans]